MKLHYHFSPYGFSNCYVLGMETRSETSVSHDAIIIDPGNMDTDLLSIIEDHNYTLKGVLITHDHNHHVRGLKTIMKIYNAEVFAINPAVKGQRTTIVKDGDILNIGPFKTEVISIPGHSADSAVYKIERLIFTGDSLFAGFMGSTASSYAAATQRSALRNKLLSLPGHYIVLPGHGPPSSLEAERRYNLDLNSLKQQKKRRPAFWEDT